MLRLVKLYAVLFLLISSSCTAFAAGTAMVEATCRHLPDGRVEYVYRVKNNGKSNIAMLWIGYVFRGNEPELDVMPVGWDFFKGLPNGSCTSPAGWNGSVITQEESTRHFIEWSIKETGAVPFNPGMYLDGFSVILPRADDSYLNCHFTVFFDADEPYSARISK